MSPIRKSTPSSPSPRCSPRVALLPAAAGAATGRTVAVTASATVKVPNDTAKIGFGVKREAKTRAAALQATAAGLRKVIAAAESLPRRRRRRRADGTDQRPPGEKGKVTVYRATEGAR